MKQRGAIEVMLIVLIVAVIAVAAGMWGIYEFGYARGKASEAKAWEEEKAQLVADLAEAKADAASKIDDMMAAYEAGKAKGRIVYQTIQAKGKSDVTTYPVFNNPDCVLPADSLRNLQDARSGMRSPANPAAAPAPVRAPVVGAPR